MWASGRQLARPGLDNRGFSPPSGLPWASPHWGGMFSQGGGWAIPIAPLTLIAAVGGIVDRPVVRDGHIVARPMLPLTLTFDHGVIDGAPAIRFVQTLF